MHKSAFSFGDKVKVLAGKYAGTMGVVVDPETDSDALPASLPGHYWIRVTVQSLSVPLHVRWDEIGGPVRAEGTA
jgi:hypothetical protein